MKSAESMDDGLRTGARIGSQESGERRSLTRRLVAPGVWGLGVLVFALTCIGIHLHPQPFPFDLALMQELQRLQPGSVLDAVVRFPSVLDNPFGSTVLLSCWLVFLLAGTVWSWLKKKRWLCWLQNLVFLIVLVASSSGVNTVLDLLVARPRPLAKNFPIQNLEPIVPFPSYPSGHAAHDVVYYGFLLYLSQTRPVRQWRYHRWLLPLQIFAVCEILLIGFSRVRMGGHWPTDVLGGYMEGALYLSLFIFLYQLAMPLQEKWQHAMDRKRQA